MRSVVDVVVRLTDAMPSPCIRIVWYSSLLCNSLVGLGCYDSLTGMLLQGVWTSYNLFGPGAKFLVINPSFIKNEK